MKIKYAPRAFRDIDELLDKIRMSGAKTLSVAIELKVEHCALVPYAGSRTDRPEIYRAPISHHRLTIFYRVDSVDEAIEVLRVVRGGRVKNLRRIPDDDD